MGYYEATATKSASATTYLDIAQVKNYLKVEYNITAEDALITSLIKSAESQFEEYTNKALNAHSVTLTISYMDYDGEPVLRVNLPYTGVYANFVVYKLYRGVVTTLVQGVDYYDYVNNIHLQRSVGVGGEELQVIITADVSPTFDDESVKPALYQLIADMYENRTNESIEQVYHIKNSTRALLMPFKDSNTFL